MRTEVGITAKTGLVVHCRLIGSWPAWVMQAAQTLEAGCIMPFAPGCRQQTFHVVTVREPCTPAAVVFSALLEIDGYGSPSSLLACRG